VRGIPLGPFGVTLLATAVALLVMMAVTFAVALKVGRHSVVDSAWGIGIALTAVVSLLASAGHGQAARRYLLLAAAVIWGLRLSGYVTWRNHGQGEDPRYRDLLNKAKGNKNLYALRSVYLLQALTLWLACLPIQAGMLERAPVGAVTAVGAAVWLGGFLFESVGDWQLARFKANPANQGQIMNRGLWQYTRHPNYFGDFCMWWGLFLIALGSWAELPTAIGPLLMSFTLIRGTGGRLTDRRMAATRPQYADYAARTSGFFPLPPRKSRLGRTCTPSCSRYMMARRWIGGRPPPRHLPSYPPVGAASWVRRGHGRCQVMSAVARRSAAGARPGTDSGTSARPARAARRCWRSGRAGPPAR
jgi:steroid 5-alpha reductase family enzyme